MYRNIQTENFKFSIFDLLTLDGLDLTRATKVLERYLEVSQTRAMPFNWLCFILIPLPRPAKPAMTVKNLAYNLSCDVTVIFKQGLQ